MADSWTLRVQDFRCLNRVKWSPEGVCLLSAPNGSGKTSILGALQILRNIYFRGLHHAIQEAGGASHLRRRLAEPDSFVTFELQVEGLAWTVQIPIEGAGFHPLHGERLVRDGEVVLDVKPFEANWHYEGEERTRRAEMRSPLRVISDKWEPTWLEPLIAKLKSLRVYSTYWLQKLREPFVPTDELYLRNSGFNLWSVLKNWQTSRPYHDQFQWVLDQAAKAFPELIQYLDFHPTPSFYPPDSQSGEEGLPVHLAADGLLTGLLHLTAVSGAKADSIIAFDEVENQLHPHAIRSILTAMREVADERNLTIILTTHSPVVMNEFKGHEDQFYIIEDGHSDRPVPVPLEEARNPDWLAHFELGSLYERNEIAPQAPAQKSSKDS